MVNAARLLTASGVRLVVESSVLSHELLGVLLACGTRVLAVHHRPAAPIPVSAGRDEAAPRPRTLGRHAPPYPRRATKPSGSRLTAIEHQRTSRIDHRPLQDRADRTPQAVANLRPGRDRHPRIRRPAHHRRPHSGAADLPPAIFETVHQPNTTRPNTAETQPK